MTQGSAVATSGGHLNTADAPIGIGQRSADYLSSTSQTAPLGGSGADQCSLQLSARTGAWVCPTDPSATGGVAPADTASCNSDGACWYVTDNYHAHNNMQGWFGWGDTTLGNLTYSQRHSLNGAQFITKPDLHTSTSLQNLEAQGDLLHGDPGTIGTPVDGQTDYTSKSSLAAGGDWLPWGSNGYTGYDIAKLYHANVVEVSWNKGSYPGYWFMYMKAPIADDSNGNNIYDFDAASRRLSDSANIGYHD